MKRRQRIVELAVMALLAAAGAHAEELSLNEAVNSLLFPGSNYTDKRKPKAGDTLYGWTYIERPAKVSEQRQAAYWCMLLAEGKTRWQQANDPKKSGEVPWYCWYRAEVFYHFEYSAVEQVRAPGMGLTEQGKQFLDPRNDKMSDVKLVNFNSTHAIGDGAISGSGNITSCVHAVSGPLYLTTRVECRFQIGIDESLLPSHISGRKPSYPSDKAWPEKDRLAAEFEKYRRGREDAAVRLARQIVSGWEAWCSRKIGPGPGLRGLYWDLRPYALFPEDMPAGFKCTNHNEENIASTRSRPQHSIALYYSRKRGTEQQQVFESQSVSVRLCVAHQKKPFDDALEEARAEFAKRPSVASKTKSESLGMNGADEAKVVYTEGSSDAYLIARRANVVIEVRGSCSPREDPMWLPLTKQLGQKILDRMRGATSPGTQEGVQVALSAAPPALWADGKSRSRIRLTCRDAAGQVLPGTFTLTAKGPGSLEAETLTLDASGLAETGYTAGTVPGNTVITAAGPAGTSTVTVNGGGLAIAPAKEGQWQVLADGKAALLLIVRAVGLDGKPLAGLRVTLRAEENELPQRGTLAPDEVQLDGSGSAQIVYTPPLIAAGSGFRMGDVYVNAAAKVTGPSETLLESAVRLTVAAGEGATLLVEKAGFKAVRVPISLAAANSELRGQVVARAPNGATFPLAYATLRVVGADGKRPIGAGRSEAGGAFAFECVSSPLAGSGNATALPAPVEVPLDEALLAVLEGAHASLKELGGAGFEVAPAVRYIGGALQRLAQSDSQGEPGQRPDAVGSSAYRLGLLAVYIRLVHNRQLEGLDWFMESIDPVVDELVDMVADLSELEEKAKEKLGEKFDQLVWQRLRKTAAGRVLRRLNVWLRKNTRNLRALDKNLQEGMERGEKFNEAVGLQSEEGGEDGVTPAGLLHDVLNPLDALTPDLKLPDPDGGESVDLKTWFLKTLKRSIRKPLENALRVQAQEELDAALKRLTYSGPGPGSLEEAKAAALAQFAAYQEAHMRLNIRNLDAELYRLDAKLFADTVIKGVVIYLDARKTIAEAGVKALRSLTSEQFLKIQEAVTGGGEKVDKAAKFLDGALRVYQGQAWLRDTSFAGDVIGALAGVLAP
ncbi:MAG: Ig-like domain-containing protein [Planctomycetes bacterium]|nr:Ig-like domain-containing protein [Planctomycetota bacterium]